MADPESTDAIVKQNEIEMKTEVPETSTIAKTELEPNTPPVLITTPIIIVHEDLKTEQQSPSQGDPPPHNTVSKVGTKNNPKPEDYGFQITSSLIRKTYIYKDNARKERTGRKLTFVDEVSDTEPLTITKYSDTLHYAPLLRSEHNRGNGFVEVKNSGGCCLIS